MNESPKEAFDRTDGYVVELNNGDQEERLTELPNGMVYGSLKAATLQKPEIFRTTILMKEFSGDGVFIYVPRGVRLDKPVFITDNYACEEGKETVGSTNVIMIDSDASLEVFYRLASLDGRPCKAVKRIRFFIGENSTYKQCEYLDNPANVEVISDTIIYQMSGAKSGMTVVKTGAGYAKLDYSSDMKWPDSETKYSVLYLGGNDERTDVDISIRHNVPDCRSDVLVKGVAGGSSVGSFTGMVYVAQDAQRTEAYQQSRSLLLSDTAQILTSPQLEIYADDVKCSHGATVGQQDGDEVYYMRQRGLSEEQARALQLSGFVGEIVGRIPEGEYHDMVAESVEHKINEIK